MTDRNERRPGSADKTVRDIRRATRRNSSTGKEIRYHAGRLARCGAELNAHPREWSEGGGTTLAGAVHNA